MRIIDFLRSVPLFAGLEEKVLEEIAGLFKVCTYPRNKVIFFQAEEGDNFYVIKSGSVKVYRLAEDGREVILDIFKPGDFFGEMALLDDNHRSATVQTREPTVLLAMNRQLFRRLIQENPEIALGIISTLSRRLRQANLQIENFAFRDARARIIHSILKVGKKGGTFSGKMEQEQLAVNLTHHELASLAGTSRETVSRVLVKMQEEGLVRIVRNTLIVPDPATLENKML